MSSNHYETALSVLRAVEQHDEPGVAKLLSDDFEHKIYPPSMHGIIGRPWITNKDETLKTIFRDRVLITRFGVSPFPDGSSSSICSQTKDQIFAPIV